MQITVTMRQRRTVYQERVRGRQIGTYIPKYDNLYLRLLINYRRRFIIRV